MSRRRDYRTLIRVTDVRDGFAHCIIPGWSLTEIVKIPVSEFHPKNPPKPGLVQRYHAVVNLAAKNANDLHWRNFEPD